MKSQNQFKIQVIESPIIPEAVFQVLGKKENGAQLLFFGTVRNYNQGKDVLAVFYDAFEPLLKTIFLEICNEVDAKWGPGLNIIVIHRVGRLGVGDISIAIGIGSPHREEVYLASRYMIENIKTRAPIWKKEIYKEEESEWLSGHALCGQSSEL